MEVSVRTFGVLREYVPDPRSGETSLDLPEGATVLDALTALGAPPGLLHACLVDGQRAEAHQRLVQGSEVTLMPPFSGGDSTSEE